VKRVMMTRALARRLTRGRQPRKDGNISTSPPLRVNFWLVVGLLGAECSVELLSDITKQVGQHFRSPHFATILRAAKLRQQVGA
jgi:hypothetical protein